MSARISAADARALLRQRKSDPPRFDDVRGILAPNRSKYGNIPTQGPGDRTYASRLEARHAETLDVMKRAGLIRGWLPQVSLPIPGTKRRMIIDFLVIDAEGRLQLQDAKGVATKDWKLKAELIESALGLPIEIVMRTR